MLHDYDKPEYAYKDPEYEYCVDDTECRILRVFKTYVQLVTDMYGKPPLTRISFKGAQNFRNTFRSRYRAMRDFVSHLDEAGVEDPGHFVAYFLETWKNREHYHKYRDGDHPYLARMSGVAYPSIKMIMVDGVGMIPEFVGIPNYRPKQFVPLADLAEFDKWVMRRRVERWCASRGAKPVDYWLEVEHLFPPYLTAPWVKYAESLQECEEAIKEKFGFSIQELQTFLDELQRAMKDPLVPKEAGVIAVEVDDNCHPPAIQDRIAAYQEAIDRGMDVTSPWLQQKVEDEVNPIDTEHPDTIMWYLHGVGSPRRLDGEVHDG